MTGWNFFDGVMAGGIIVFVAFLIGIFSYSMGRDIGRIETDRAYESAKPRKEKQ